MVGKLPPELMDIVFKFRGIDDPQVVVGPAIGEDAAVINLDGMYLVVHSDPITEAASRVGWLAVNVAANDVAVTGAAPRWASIVILLPENGVKLLKSIVEDIDRAAKELGVAVVGGHTEEAPGVEKPTVIATVMGVTRRYVATSGARPGDVIIMVKHGALEGTAILAYDFEKMLLGRGVEKEVVETALDNNYTSIIIADHGNSEKMINKDGSVNTAHTVNSVPLILVDKDIKHIKKGALANIAPTILELMGIEKPKEMDMNSLL